MDRLVNLDWSNAHSIPSTSFTCGHCGKALVSEFGYFGRFSDTGNLTFLYICHFCKRPTFIHADVQIPGVPFGDPVKHLPEDIAPLYEQIRDCAQVNAWTPAVLACRKLLMHIAVEKGDDEGKRFAEYVTFLHDNHWTPPDSEMWVDSIRSKGNEANHQIVMASREDAEQLIDFAAMLLKFIYEYPKKIQPPQAEAPAPEK